MGGAEKRATRQKRQAHTKLLKRLCDEDCKTVRNRCNLRKRKDRRKRRAEPPPPPPPVRLGPRPKRRRRTLKERSEAAKGLYQQTYFVSRRDRKPLTEHRPLTHTPKVRCAAPRPRLARGGR